MIPTLSAPKKKYVDAIKQDMEWLGLHWDQVLNGNLSALDQYAAAADKLREHWPFL